MARRLNGVEVYSFIIDTLVDKWEQSHYLSQQIPNSQNCTLSLSKQWASPFIGLMNTVGPVGSLATM